MKPLDDRVFILPDEAEDTTLGGIVLPDIAKHKPHRGKVIAVGPGKILGNGQRTQMSVRVGDNIVYALYEGIDVSIEAGNYLALHESEIMAVIVD